jgi:hypothetical protein
VIARALAIDLDGTLLGADGRVSERNLRALESARDAGLELIIATARWVQNAERVARPLGLRGPVIACSGAQVRRLAEGTDAWDLRLPLAFAQALFAVCDAMPCLVWAALDERVLMKIEGDVELAGYPELERVGRLEGAADAAPRIVMVQGRRARQRVVEALRAEWKERVRFVTSLTTQGHELLTLTATGADKGAALEAACGELGLLSRDVVAIGDAENDIEMFEAAGASFAMGQASPDVKAAATAVTGTNAEDGVAQAIERVLRDLPAVPRLRPPPA